MKEYWVIQNGVSTSYDWICPLDTFYSVNGLSDPGHGGINL